MIHWKKGYVFILILFVCIGCQEKEIENAEEVQEIEEELTMDE